MGMDGDGARERMAGWGSGEDVWAQGSFRGGASADMASRTIGRYAREGGEHGGGGDGNGGDVSMVTTGFCRVVDWSSDLIIFSSPLREGSLIPSFTYVPCPISLIMYTIPTHHSWDEPGWAEHRRAADKYI
ncbi:hypothetical protein BOTBODRAFT_192044 [Botryobasidium botryosum FD-172 SS1]|uniref:Uncharacterized protein n=1 Tax=Botryobasidium botryosum (strain FD-172 SS1) TaxID=930990 RepID=A0A067LZZ3_BOTB1|nr:hypothetical protein BOTBODRAFT_192044 [Botryobasidium botryosum FD-172 SS1]